MLRMLFSHIKKIRIIVLQYILILLILWTVEISIPYISGIYINYLVQGIDINKFIIFVLMLGVASLTQMLFQYFRALIGIKLNNSMTYQISNDIFQKIFCSKYINYNNIDSAYYIDQINKDSNTIVNFFTSNVVNLFLQIATIIICGVIVFNIDILLSSIIFSLIPFYILTFNVNKMKMQNARKDARQKSNEYFSRYSEQINKLSYIKRNALDKEMESRLKLSFIEMFNSTIHSVSLSYFFMNLNQIFIIIAYLGIIGIGGYKVNAGILDIGYFTIINTYFNMIISSVSYFLGLAGTYQDTKISYERIIKIMNAQEECFGTKFISNLQSIHIRDISIKFEERIILNRCSYIFKKGMIYGIKGQNGAGKTTFLNAIMGVFSGKPSGEIFYNDLEINDIDMFQMRREKISYLEQDPFLLNISVKHYLSFGLSIDDAIYRKQKKLLQIWNIEYLLEKDINENGSNLSGGEKQKLSMVRTLSKNSELILLDEPTSSLDKASILSLLNLLNEIKENAIILMVSHDPIALKCCDEVFDIINIQSNCY